MQCWFVDVERGWQYSRFETPLGITISSWLSMKIRGGWNISMSLEKSFCKSQRSCSLWFKSKTQVIGAQFVHVCCYLLVVITIVYLLLNLFAYLLLQQLFAYYCICLHCLQLQQLFACCCNVCYYRCIVLVNIKVACSLYKLTHGVNYHQCNEMFAIGKSSVNMVLHEFVIAINVV